MACGTCGKSLATRRLNKAKLAATKKETPTEVKPVGVTANRAGRMYQLPDGTIIYKKR